MLVAYCDESETPHDNVPVVAVGGLLLSGKDSKRLARHWDEFLELHHIRDRKGNRVFHTHEFESPGGREGTMYEGLSEDKRKEIQNDILSIFIYNREVTAHVCAAVPKADFESVMTEERVARFGDAQAFCAFMCIVMMADWTHIYYPQQRISYTFELGGTYEKQLKRAYERLLESEDAQEYYKLWTGPTFAPKDKEILLQPADKIVYEAAKETSHLLDENPLPQHAEMLDGKPHWRMRYPSRVLAGLQLDTKVNYFLAEDIERVASLWEQGHSMWERQTVVYQDYSFRAPKPDSGI